MQSFIYDHDLYFLPEYLYCATGIEPLPAEKNNTQNEYASQIY